MRELFDSAVIEPEPPLRAGYAEETLHLARRSARRRHAAATLVVAACVVLVAVTVGWARPTRPAVGPATPPSTPASVPDRLPAYSPVTGSVSDSPPGRVIALYSYGWSEPAWPFPNALNMVAGADADAYRHVDGFEAGASHLLAPDGTRLVAHAPFRRELTLVDLTSGHRRAVPTVVWQNPFVDLDLLAWSPDGRYIAYAVPSGDGRAQVRDRPVKHLVVLDLTTAVSTAHPAMGPVWSASFGPSSRELAVQLVGEVWITTVDGQLVRPVPLPLGRDLVPEVAWSPDGELLATTGPGGGSLEFLDATGSGRAVPAPVSGDAVLGWRSPDTLVVHARTEQGSPVPGGSIEELAITTGGRTRLSTFSDKKACQYGHSPCLVSQLKLATGLLPTLVVRPAGPPDYGPWPIRFRIATLAAAAGVVLLAWWITRRLRRRRAGAPPP
jgi:hypothetical protein